jgi:hypothetical protein
MKKKSKAPKAKTEKARPGNLATIVTKIKRTFRDDICNIIRRGELLQQGKDQIEDGVWLTWLETNFNWDEEMAQRAMSVAKFAAKYDTVSALNLTKGVLYGLAAGGFPDKVVKAVLKEATSGPIRIERLYEITRKRPARDREEVELILDGPVPEGKSPGSLAIFAAIRRASSQ